MLRASDADREAVVGRLRSAAVEGRLETEELDERVEAALRARTYGELDGLLTDLPDPAPPRRTQRRIVPALQSALGVAIVMLVTVAVIATVIAIVAMAAAWWAMWVLFWFFACGRGGCSMRRFGAAPSRRMRGVQRTRPAGLH